MLQLNLTFHTPASPESSVLVSSTCFPLLFVRKMSVARGFTEESKIQNYMLSSCSGNQLLINISKWLLIKIIACVIDGRTLNVPPCPWFWCHLGVVVGWGPQHCQDSFLGRSSGLTGRWSCNRPQIFQYCFLYYFLFRADKGRVN